MAEAVVGDDVYGEDPTVNELEQMAAELMGKESAVFTASGTMSNLLAVLAQTRHGDEIILGGQAHMFWYEVAGVSALAGVLPHTVENRIDGTMSPDSIRDAIRTKNIHYPPSTLICLENTHNRCGGAVLSAEYTESIGRIAHEHDMRLHIDGARIFNAAIALGVVPRNLARGSDSVSFCLSKGLSAPVGSMLCGDQSFVERARKFRKMIGGGMRQAGVIAAAGILSIRKMIPRLAEDHANARLLAEGLTTIPGVLLTTPSPTNIVMFELAPQIKAQEFLRAMDLKGLRLSHRGGQGFRAVTHRMVTSADVTEALGHIRTYLGKVS
jgi:threonine aldolase